MESDEELEFQSLLQKDLPISSALLQQQKAQNTNRIAAAAGRMLGSYNKCAFEKLKGGAGMHVDLSNVCNGLQSASYLVTYGVIAHRTCPCRIGTFQRRAEVFPCVAGTS